MLFFRYKKNNGQNAQRNCKKAQNQLFSRQTCINHFLQKHATGIKCLGSPWIVASDAIWITQTQQKKIKIIVSAPVFNQAHWLWFWLNKQVVFSDQWFREGRPLSEAGKLTGLVLSCRTRLLITYQKCRIKIPVRSGSPFSELPVRDWTRCRFQGDVTYLPEPELFDRGKTLWTLQLHVVLFVTLSCVAFQGDLVRKRSISIINLIRHSHAPRHSSILNCSIK